ncbi:protein-glutamate O-methyltransferase CheR [Siccirubricoccus sp. G192]|uniref:CheR family methyltransferase n=1 Tax=Siccirubricoccus sp. G192 TaxID=2849651 RepID=UPI001C2C56E8|nr:protein-glutamate O-methyltransferase CheR [Siccirubricoccus sp. G192]MBV1800344.1 protein-glutamate O-methyltransferase CheR [Siccirubricoccus sp. G192]MBV1800566.1 protein-glutamate O-methyltransferase CheR [Siccirubricoccus sp. G192]
MSGPGAFPAEPPSAEELRRLCDFIYRRSGLSYGESKRTYIERRLAMGMERSSAPSFLAYMALLRVNPAEAERLINSVTVNETYFYREEHQLQCLGRSLLPEIVAARGPGDLVRLWSMPCSTGEEPYSIAIWLLENWALVDAYNIEIVGSDLDTEVLAAALEGRYGKRALSRLPPGVVERYFEPPHGHRRQIIRDLRESVRFTLANLVDADSMAAQGRFDVVFCRNVLIYFDEAARQAASRHLFAALNPGGFLCLGHSESMARISERFIARRFENAIVYQRPVGA